MDDDHDPLGDRLRQAAGQVAQRRAVRLAEHGVTPAEWTLLRELHAAGAVSPSALAARIGLTRGAVTKLVDRLRAKRLVVRAGAGRDDRRYRTIALTGAGVSLLPTLTAAAARGDDDAFARLTATDRAALIQLLAAILPFPDGDLPG